jgi:hypothetical protein
MSTVVVARKGGHGGHRLRQPGHLRRDPLPPATRPTRRCSGGGTTVRVRWAAWRTSGAAQRAGRLPKDELKLGSRDEVFDTFLKLHPKLKERFFLNTKEHDSDPYESSQFIVLIANPHGIFGVESYREVFEFERFWAIGSGRRFALGAMHAVFERAKSAREVAAGVLAGCEFDTSSAGPVRLHTYKLKNKT